MRIVPSHPRREQAFNIPGLVVGAIGFLLVVHAIREWLPAATDLELLLSASFIPARWSLASGWASADDILRAVGQDGSGAPLAPVQLALARYVVDDASLPVWSWLSHAALHGSWAHVGLNGVWLAAFASPVVRRAGTGRSLMLALAACLGGAAAQWAADPLAVQPMIGASAIVSGFMAAAATFVFRTPGREPPFGPSSSPGPWSFLRNRNALVFLAVWVAGNVLFGTVATPVGLVDGSIAWQAHLGGLLVGLILFPVIDPGRARSPSWHMGA